MSENASICKGKERNVLLSEDGSALERKFPGPLMLAPQAACSPSPTGSGSLHRNFSHISKHAWRANWSALGLRHRGDTDSRLGASGDDSAVEYATLSSHVSLLTFMQWHGTLLEGSQGNTSAMTPPADRYGARVSASSTAVGGRIGVGSTASVRYYLVRLANIADPRDLPQVDSNTSIQDIGRAGGENVPGSDGSSGSDPRTLGHRSGSHRNAGTEDLRMSSDREEDRGSVDLCTIVNWPMHSRLTVAETTLSGNRRLKSFEKNAGFKFETEAEAMCFKEDRSECASLRYTSVLSSGEKDWKDVARGPHLKGTREHGGCGEAIEALSVDCSRQVLHVCIQPMHVRTFIVAVDDIQ